MGFVRIIMGILILFFLASAIIVAMVAGGHETQDCIKHLMSESEVDSQQAKNDCEWIQKYLVDFRYVLYAIAGVLIVICAIIFAKVD